MADVCRLLMPTPPSWKTGPVATWVTAAGWARGLQQRLGETSLVTPAGRLTPEGAELLVAGRQSKDPGTAAGLAGRALWRSVRSVIPEPVHTARKDLRDLGRGIRFIRHAFDRSDSLKLVWQHHELFQVAGNVMAQRAHVPVIQFVDAPIVWEGEMWGVRRPWGHALEVVGESPQLKWADLVACVSDDVRDAAIARGAPPNRTIVTPCAVQMDHFSHAKEDGRDVRQRLGIPVNDVVIGWLGSFRRFHGVGLLLEAIRSSGLADRVHLVFVGDGQERATIEDRARELGLHRVHFVGLVGHLEVAAHIGAFDIAVVTAPSGGLFHYSPLKLKEYMSAGLAIVAPAVGEVGTVLVGGQCGVLVAPGDPAGLGHALARLVDDSALRSALGARAKAEVEANGTWLIQVDRAIETLRTQGWQL